MDQDTRVISNPQVVLLFGDSIQFIDHDSNGMPLAPQARQAIIPQDHQRAEFDTEEEALDWAEDNGLTYVVPTIYSGKLIYED